MDAPATEAVDADARTTGSPLPRVVALVAGAFFVLTGLGAMLAPQAFFGAAATFEPYNEHFLQDIGAFNLGLGAVLLLAARDRADALVAALAGAAIGSGAHVVSHVMGIDAGGTPAVDLPLFASTTVIVGWAAWVRHRDTRHA